MLPLCSSFGTEPPVVGLVLVELRVLAILDADPSGQWFATQAAYLGDLVVCMHSASMWWLSQALRHPEGDWTGEEGPGTCMGPGNVVLCVPRVLPDLDGPNTPEHARSAPRLLPATSSLTFGGKDRHTQQAQLFAT